MESYALPFHYPFDTPNQTYCFDEDSDFHLIPIDDITNKEHIVKERINLAALHISNQTIMDLSELDCNQSRIAVLTDSLMASHLDGEVVPDVLSTSDFNFKFFYLNTNIAHSGYSIEKECVSTNDDPNIQYIGNHEWGHVAGLDHPDTSNQITMMNPDCDEFYENIQEQDIDTINSLYPNFLPSWIEESADKWSMNEISDSEYLNSMNFIIEISVISIPDDHTCNSPDPIIPLYVRNNAGWWIAGDISDQEYADGLAYMVKHCIIQLGNYADVTQNIPQILNPVTAVSQIFNDYSIIPTAFGLEDNNNDSNNNSNIILTSHTPPGNTITMAGNYITPACEPDCFMPAVETIGVGDSVTFVNSKSSVTVIASGDPFSGTDGVFNTGDIESGQSKTVTFTQEGVYNYFDLIAPWMQGTIIVDDAPPTENAPPTANAGDPQTKDEGDIVVLSGSESTDPENAVLRYSWKQISGPLVQLSGSNFPGGVSNGQGTNFIAPEVTASEVLVFELTVKDDLLQPDTAMVSITVNDVVETVNNMPVADAGADQPTVDENTLVTLDGSASSDPDGDDITYLWEQTSGGDVDLDDVTAQSPTFTAPEVTGIINLTFKLIVHDELDSGSEPDYVTITINNVEAPPVNTAPIARNDQRTVLGIDPTILDILHNDEDLDDGDSITIISIDTDTNDIDGIVTHNGNNVTFTASSDSTYETTFMYTISDGSLPATAMVTVNVIGIGDTGDAIWYEPNFDVTVNANFGKSVTALANGKIVGAAPGGEGKLFVLNGMTGDLLLPIDNPNAIFGESFGSDLASLGNNIIVGNSGYDAGIESNVGQVYVFDDITGAVLFGGPIQNPEPSEFDKFGDTVTATDTLIFVGAPSNDVIVSESQSNNVLLQAPTIDDSVLALSIDDATNTAQLIDNTTLEIIAQNFPIISYNEISPSPTFTENEDIIHDEPVPTLEINPALGTMTLMDGATNEMITSVTLNSVQLSSQNNDFVLFSNQNIGTSYLFDGLTGDLVLVEYTNAGSVYVFDGTTGAYLSPPIDNPNPVSNDNFGASLASFGDNIVIGVPGDDNDGAGGAGSVYVFDGNTKSEIHYIPNPSVGGGGGDDFGTSVGFAGGIVVVGSPDDSSSDDGNTGTKDGAIHLIDGTTGIPLDHVPNPSPSISTTADMGDFVSINDNGIVIAGAPDSESVFVFSFDGTDTTFVKEIQNPEIGENADFGTSVTLLDDDTIAIGIPGDDPFSSGAVALFSSAPPPNNFPVAVNDDNINVINDNSITIDVLSNDTDEDADDSLTIDSVNSSGTQGIVTNNGGDDITFAANLNFDGVTTFSYKVTDGNGGLSNTATVSVTVSDTLAPVISLIGDNPQILEVGQGYVELGAIADDGYSQITPDTLEFVDAIGTYTVYYDSVDVNDNVAATVTRTINVVDVTSPTIFVPDNQTFEATTALDTPLSASDYGTATATDDVDSNPVITSDAPALFPLGITTITWTATDSSGNITTDTQIITLQDTTDPVITLIGDNPQTLDVGDVYIELGATAVDNIDGDVSANIVIDSVAVDVNVASSYPVRYDVSDSSGNSPFTEFRNVVVVAVDDITPPQITIDFPTDGSTINSSDVTISGTATDEQSGITGVDISVGIDPAQPATLEPDGTWSHVLTNLDDGDYSITATTTNGVELTTTTDPPITITINTSISTPFSDWQYKKSITIDETQVAADLTDFPLLVSITDTDLQSNAQADGDDIIFTQSGGTTILPHEIEQWDNTTGELVAWVKTDLSSNTNTEITIYYGNPAAVNQENASAVWNDNYLGVWHLNDDFIDSTTNNHDGTNSGSTDVAGYIADGQEFDGIDDEITFGDFADGLSAITIQQWKWNDDLAQSNIMLHKFIGSDAAKRNFLLWMDDVDVVTGAPDAYAFFVAINTSGGENRIIANDNSAIANQWQYVTAVWERNTINGMFMYVDGIKQDNTINTSNVNLLSSDVIVKTGGNDNGRQDEIRILNTPLSDDWIVTEYNNHSSPGTFYAVGTQVDNGTTPQSDTTPPQITIDFPTDGSTINSSDVTISGTATDVESGITQVIVSIDGTAQQPPVTPDTNNNWSYVTNLTDATYSITATATNGATLATTTNPPITITIDTTTSTPFSDWQYKKSITIDETQVAADLTDYPLLVSITADPDLFANAQADGDDIIFTQSGGTTILPHEIEQWDDTTGELVAWVKTDLSSNTNTEIVMYYGNPAAVNSEDSDTVWSDYDMALHLNDDTLDSTINHNDGTNNGSTNSSSCIIADCQSFDEINDRITVADHPTLDLPDGDWTVQMWVQSDDNSGTAFQYFYSHGAVSTPNSMNVYFIEDNLENNASVSDSVRNTHGDADDDSWNANDPTYFDSSSLLGANTDWQQFVYTRSGDTMTFYVNTAVE